MSDKSNPYSYIKIFRHKEKLDAIARGEVTPPIYVRIKPTSVCNHSCYYCSYRNPTDNDIHISDLRANFNSRDQIPEDIMMALIDDLAEMKVKAVTFSGGGEPLVYPYIEEALRRIIAAGIDLSIITNGHLLNGEKAQLLARAKWVRISMDSCRPERYAKIRGLKSEALNEIAGNIRRFSQIKAADCELGINFVIMPDNADEVYEAACFAKDAGVNHIKFCAVIHPDIQKTHKSIAPGVLSQIEKAEQELSDERFQIINKYAGDLELNAVFKRTYKRCPVQQIIPVVASDCKIYLCHDKAYVPGGELGSLRDKTFKEIWFSPETKKRFAEFDARKECAHHCVYDQRNMLINQFIDLDDSQVNFI